jgi:hypothetical protein
MHFVDDKEEWKTYGRVTLDMTFSVSQQVLGGAQHQGRAS